uniref:serine/arginine-rich SC35-like splicing factor SCL30 n=1 Tax=Erigeron canadensis TaxID=72917 RepID=UPI001CB9B059|nr:serine/arginine-rich SC35-like splicing factor SCL30 [Erigeron canadensis]XP_043632413.1 serine/arginine-rich SC35-like splicing factor SCL30 [Erigeron canadensis]XP_043632414.1 serine/arginine-rich SC35-like splicing factor SCL30 [Erigeron canadensis]
MRRYSPPRRGYGGRPRSPPRRAYGGERERGRPKEQNHGSLLVRNIPLNCRPEELRVPFERYGVVRDVYLPKNYYTGEPRGFAFVQFVDAYDAVEAQHHMNGRMFAGREISVVLASESRKRPEEMRRRTSVRGPSGHDDRRTYHGRSRSLSRSRSPRRLQDTKSRHRSRSYSPAPKRQRDYSPSPVRRQPRSPRGSPLDHDHARRSYSPGYDGAADQNVDRSPHKYDRRRGRYRSSPGGASRSPPGSRSRSADISPPRE